jgi:hypothetical protein
MSMAEVSPSAMMSAFIFTPGQNIAGEEARAVDLAGVEGEVAVLLVDALHFVMRDDGAFEQQIADRDLC